ncbi:MAG: helix-turn-helix transcriptional regulator [Akkermansiaceae bacterium]|nr:helix-turn-helix transcriptional regulator [Akkermansiaceae bacterium]
MAAHHQNIVGSCVRRFRIEADLSQDALAAKLQLQGWDISRAGISKIEARLRRVNDAELWMLAKALSRPLEDFYPTGGRGIREVLRHGAK